MAVQTKAKYGRVLLKLSGEALLGDRKFGVSPEYTRYLAEEIRKVHDLGVQVAVVIGGGNIMRGAAVAEHGIEEATGHYMGMLAMVINALALQSQIESVGVPVRVQSAITLAEARTVASVVLDISNPDAMVRSARGEQIGTLVHSR